MYIASVPNRTSPPAILLRESFRQDGKVKNGTLANLSAWPLARIDALRRLLRGDLDTARAGDPTSGLVFGLLFALKRLADELGLTTALGHPRHGKLQIVIGLLADSDGDPLAVRVFAGNTGDPATVVEQITIIKRKR